MHIKICGNDKDLLQELEKRIFDIFREERQEISVSVYEKPSELIESKIEEQDVFFLNIDVSELEEAVLAVKELWNKGKRICRIHVGNEKRILKIDDICYLESQGHYVIFHLKNQEEVKVRGKITDYEEIMQNEDFLYPHKSYLISCNCITAFRTNDILLENDVVVHISRERKDRINEQYMKYIGRKMGNELLKRGIQKQRELFMQSESAYQQMHIFRQNILCCLKTYQILLENGKVEQVKEEIGLLIEEMLSME